MDRNKKIIQTSFISIITNILLAGFKAFIGLMSHSIAIVLDAVNNLSDALSSLITIIGAKLAAKPADKKHPFGYGRIEYMTSLIVGALIVYAGVTSLIESIREIMNPETPNYATVSLIIVAVGVVVKLLLGRYVKSVGEKEDRTKKTLEKTVKEIFKVIKHMEHEVWYKYPEAVCRLPEEVFFITSQELEDLYPTLSPKEREDAITRDKKCVFIEQIGKPLKLSGRPHDGRAPDYDDWDLNGDLFFYLPSLDMALELSSMGIRVDEDSIKSQCKASYCEGRLTLPYHQMIINKELPYTIGGGIGQSRLCMLLLNKAHVGEVQASAWPEEMIEECEKNDIHLL